MKGKRVILRIGVVLIFVIGLTGTCFGAEGVRGYKDKITVSIYTVVWIPDTVREMEAAVAYWNASRPDIKIDWIRGNWNEVATYVATSSTGGQMADLVHWHATKLMEWGAKGIFHDLKGFLPQEIWDDMYPLAIKGVEDPAGNRWSAPFQWENTGIYAHRDLVEEAGLWIPTGQDVATGRGWSWETFLNAAQRFTRDVDGDGLTDRWGTLIRLTTYSLDEMLLPWFWSAGCEVMFEKEGEWIVDFGDAGRKTLRYVYDLIHTHKVMPEDMLGIDPTGARSAFEGKLYGMMQNGCWVRRIILGEAPDVDFIYMPLPVDKRMVSSAEVQGIAINKETERFDEALEVLKFFVSPHVSACIAWGDGILTPRISGMQLLHLKSPRESWDVVNAYQRWAKPWPSHPAWEPFVRFSLVPNIQGYLMGEIDLEKAIAVMEQEGMDHIAEYQ